MNVIVIASVVVTATTLIGATIAILFSWLGKTVNAEMLAVEEEKSRYNPDLTAGHKLPVVDDPEEQLAAARKLAAKRAASLPRGSNMRIGTFGDGEQPTAFDGIMDDPISAVKIAAFHTWQGLVTGATTGQQSAVSASHAPSQTVPSVKSPSDLVPGKDYPFIEIREDMSPAEKRKARIANAKARSAAVKAQKEASQTTVAAAEITADVPAVSSGDTQTIRQPEAGVDYEFTEITEDMSPDEVRKARIANAKARSAAMKKSKEAGGAPVAQLISSAPSTVGSVPAVKKEEKAAPTIPSNIVRPEYIEITDGMDPGEVRRARIHNAKARSAYNKALKEAGIDPAKLD